MTDALIVTRWVASLPTDVYEIANRLRVRGITGMQHDPIDNPLSRWCFDDTTIWPMFGDRHHATWVDGQLVETPVPLHVACFLILFDHGVWPHLIDLNVKEESNE